MRLTRPLERLLRVLLADPSAPRYGYDLMKATGLASGTLYPMLARLQTQGLVAAAWEPQPAEAAGQPADAAGRPPRKYYWLTGEGARAARYQLAQANRSASHSNLKSARPAADGTR
jgi:PadR family transcriptional regulator